MTYIIARNNFLYVFTERRDKKLEEMCSYVDPDSHWRIKNTREKAEKLGDQNLLNWINQWDGRNRIYKMRVLHNPNDKYKFEYEIPIGMLNVVKNYYSIKGTYDFIEERFIKNASSIDDDNIKKKVILRDEKQVKCAQNISENDGRGIIEATTGFGKTILGINTIQELRLPTIIIVNHATVIAQWDKVVREYFNLHRYKNGNLYVYSKSKSRGLMKALEKPFDVCIVICTADLLSSVFFGNGKTVKDRNELLNLWLEDYADHLIFDEVHEGASNTSTSVLDELVVFSRQGFSATVGLNSQNKDLEYISRIGSVIYTIQDTEIFDRESIPLKFLKVRPLSFPRRTDYDTIKKKAIIYNQHRNRAIIKVIDEMLDEDRNIAVFIENIEHARHLSQLTGFPYTEAKDGDREKKIREFKSGEIPVLFATYKLLGVGFDYEMLDTIILAGAGKGAIKLIQAVGRAKRVAEGKNTIKIFDIADNCKTLRDQAIERLNLWVNEGIYKIDVRDTYLSRYMR